MSSYAITGAARGIGFEFVNQLSAGSPANTVFALVRTKSNAQRLQELKRDNVHILEADITDVDAVKSAAAEVSKITGGGLDYLINNGARLDGGHGFLTLDGYPDTQTLETNLHAAFSVNVVGVIHTINAFLPLIKAKSDGAKKIITISSPAADGPLALKSGNAVFGPYSISKAAVNLAVAKYAAQYKKDGLVFLSLSPGWVDTAVGPPTPEHLGLLQVVLGSYQKIYPEMTGPLTAEESVKAQLKVIHNCTVADTGAFVSQNGDQNWANVN